MPKKCPYCNFFFKLIKRDLGLYECSNPGCNVILQKYPADARDKETTPKKFSMLIDYVKEEDKQ